LLRVIIKGPAPAGPDDGLPYNGGFGASQPIRGLKMAERGSRPNYYPGDRILFERSKFILKKLAEY
jgi:hypothetical protein